MTGKSAKPDSSNINPSSSNNAAPSSSQRTGTSFAPPITPQANAHPAQDEISEIGSSLTSDSPTLAHAGRDKVAEIGSPSTPSAPSPEKLRDHAERAMEAAEQYNQRIREATEGPNEESDVDDLYAAFNLISQLSDFIKKEKQDKKEKKIKEKEKEKKKKKRAEEKKKGEEKENNLSGPKLAMDSWLRSKNLLKLKEVVAEAIDVAKDFESGGDAKRMVGRFLKDIGGGHVFNIVFIVVANIWERYEDMSKNEEACLSLLEEINKFAKYVIYLQKVLQNGPESKEGMEASVKEAKEFIIETCIACCTQIEASKRRRYWSTTRGGGELAKLEKQLQQTYTRIQFQMGIGIWEAMHQPRPHHAECSKDTVGTKKPVQLRKPDYPEYPKDAGKSSSTPSSSRLPKESDYAETIMEAAKELKQNVDGDFSDLINYISRLFDFIEEKKKGENQSMPKAAVDSCLASKHFLRLKDVVSEGVNAVKDIVTVDGKTFLMGFLKGMGMAHMVTTGFLVAASILERHEAVSANKEACLYLLKEMNILAKYVQQLQQRPELKKRMEAPIIETTMLIVAASIDCCTQIGASKFSRFFSTTVNGAALANFQKRLADTRTHMEAEMSLCQFDVTNQIDMCLRKGQELKYPEYPKGAVGIEVPLKDVIERLEMGSDKNAVAVIVHGFGGMGKTTLADAVFARLFDANREGYKYSYVRLFDTITSTPNIVELQKFIIKALKMGEEPKEFQRYNEGQQQLESILEKEIVFIYIDNVLLPEKVEHGRHALEQLLPNSMGKARKLRLLLTAREKVAVRISGVKPEFYSIESLPEEEALDLFKKTLDDDSEKQLHPNQLKQIVKICGGVPKLLKVVAGFISSEENAQQAYSAVLEESKNNWKGEIGKAIDYYVFAYDKLDKKLKDPFLDICLLFRDWDWEKLSDIVGKSQLKMLENRALVTREVTSMTARVHDVILTIGLQKAEAEAERFRLTSATEIKELLDKEDEDLRKIKCIWSSDNKDAVTIPAKKLDLMSGSLRVLTLGPFTFVEGKCTRVFEKLVLFSANVSRLPFDLSKLKRFKELRHLCYKPEDLPDLSQMPSSLRHIDFELNSPAFKITSNCLQQVRNLRLLRLANAKFKKLPQELGHLVNGLQKLLLSDCEYLEELPGSISTLKSLRMLAMMSCPGLKSLPEDFGSLNSLQMLYLYDCESLKALPGSIGKLTSLQRLYLNHCRSLEALPGSLGRLTSLQVLYLNHCSSLKALPGSLGKLTSLEKFQLYECDSVETLPPSLHKLSSLRDLYISSRSIQVLPSGIGNLTSLVSLCLLFSKLNSIPESIGQSNSLNTIRLSARVKELPDGFCNLSSLTDCDMGDCPHLEKLPDRFGQLTNLRSLVLDHCESLKKLPESFSQLKCLERLSLEDCAILEELCTDFKDLSSLRVLLLNDCKMLKKLPQDFHCLVKLEVLDVRNCRVLEGKWMDSLVKMKTLQIVKIGGSQLAEERWGEIEKQRDPSWNFAVHTGQGLSNKENIAKQLQPIFDSILTDRRGEPFHISGLPLNTPLLVMFDAAKEDFRKGLRFSFIEENIDDIQINFGIVYFGSHFNELPEKLLYRVLGHAPVDSIAEALFQKVLLLDLEETSHISWRRSDMGFLTLSAKIVRDEKGDKYLSCWERLERESMEEFIMKKCGRYLKLKQLVERPRESPIELLRELFKSGENESSLAFFKEGAPTQVGVDEVKGKTILLDIRPTNLSYHVPLQSLVEMYAEVKDKGIFDFEIITIPIMQSNTNWWDTSEKFSREVPWLVLQNPWQLTNATKFFLVEGCWEERPRRWKHWPIGLDRWYPNVMRILQSNGTFAGRNPIGVLLMVNTWGIEAFPFTEGKSKELIEKEVEEIKNMPPLMFLLQHLDRVSEQVKMALHQQKIICLCTFDPEDFTDSIKVMLTELKDNIEIIYIPKFGGEDSTYKVLKFIHFTNNMRELYPPLEQPKTLEVEMQKMFLLDLSEHEAMRFWARFHILQQGMKEINDKYEQLNEMKMVLDSTTLRDIRLPGYLWMVMMDEDGNLITTRGEKFVKLFQTLQNDKAKNLIQQLVKGGKESRKETLVELEQLLNIDDVDSGSDLHEEGTPLNPAGPKSINDDSAEPSSTNDDSAQPSSANDDSVQPSSANDDSAMLSSTNDDATEPNSANDDSTGTQLNQ